MIKGAARAALLEGMKAFLIAHKEEEVLDVGQGGALVMQLRHKPRILHRATVRGTGTSGEALSARHGQIRIEDALSLLTSSRTGLAGHGSIFPCFITHDIGSVPEKRPQNCTLGCGGADSPAALYSWDSSITACNSSRSQLPRRGTTQ